jgi:hypothetical protein
MFQLHPELRNAVGREPMKANRKQSIYCAGQGDPVNQDWMISEFRKTGALGPKHTPFFGRGGRAQSYFAV